MYFNKNAFLNRMAAMNKKDLSSFPIWKHAENICDVLKKSPSRFLVLTAETGAGKSTVLPLQVMESFEGKILMTEPRRLSAIGVASRISYLMGEECGKSAGYRIHLENRTSAETRLEVVSEAILVRMMQENPSLDGISVVILDEFHERSLHIDMALAFLKEAMELRDDLFVIIMSATIDADKITDYLGGKEKTPSLNIEGRMFPVEIEYDGNLSVEDAVFKVFSETETGNILVFLPGIADIRKTESALLRNDNLPFEVFVLHSSISLEQQKKVLSPSAGKRRVILSSSIAETSLTIPDVTCVIDSGLSRIMRVNVATGMETLVTETESEFSARQRCGRAGRVQNGRCIRLWNECDKRIKDIPCEILRTSVTSLVLECAERGILKYEVADFLDRPSEASWNQAVSFLKEIKLLQSDGRISEKGEATLKLGLDLRLASIVLSSGNRKKALGLALKYSEYENLSHDVQKRFLDDVERRLERISYKEDFDDRILVLSGFPDRIARKVAFCDDGSAEYQFPSGRKALLKNESHSYPEWIVATEVLAGKSYGVIYRYETLDEDALEKWLDERTITKTSCCFSNGKVLKTESLMLGKIVLSVIRLPSSKEDTVPAWINEVENRGLECLPLSEKTKRFLMRSAFFCQQNEASENLEEKICRNVREWLPPFFNDSAVLDENIVYDALYWYLNGSLIDEKVPETMLLQNGQKCKVKYEMLSSPSDRNKLVLRPVIEIIIQKAFGCFETPSICNMKVLFRLLSPASRPLQITDDLEGFWDGAWKEICKEMKGRYPKHNWDYRRQNL